MTLLQTGLARAATATSYQISRSLRFNSADSAHLSRTPASAGNRKTWTVSGWVKKSALSTGTFFSARNTASGDMFFAMRFESNDTLNIFEYNGSAYNWQIQTTQVFRDLGAFFHLQLSVDTTQATASNRVKLYVNGVQVTALSATSYPSLNYDCYVNNAFAHSFGASNRTSIQEFLNHYLADIRLIDGQALDPTSFGETDSATGVWVPKAYTGTFGTNGFWLKFDDNSGVTATTLGKDSSGNGNNWTPNNFSVTAGVGNDSLVDSPTNYGTDTGAGGEVRGNYCTFNPLSNTASGLANGNLDLTASGAMTRANSTMAISSGKWYFEVTLNTAGTNSSVGIGQNFLTDSWPGYDALSYAYEIDNARTANNQVLTAYGSACVAGDKFMCAVDLDNNKIYFGKNGTWFNSSNPATGTNPAFTIAAGTYCPIARPYGGSASISANFGQRPFSYTAPSGFKALCTQNLPTPAIGASSSTLASKNFNIALYTGNGTSQSITGLGFQPDLVWGKKRSSATDSNHGFIDVVRGVSRWLGSNLANAEDYSVGAYVTAFGSDGYTVGTGGVFNTSGQTYVGWSWKAGGTGVSNTAGSITSTVSVNTTAGISLLTYTGTGANATVGHGLGIAPSMIMVKRRNGAGTENWQVRHTSIAVANSIQLNSTSAAAAATTVWNSTAPSSSVFSIGTSNDVNANTGTYVAYCFAEISGFSKFGSYTGNGSTDGPFVYCGFMPKFVLVKNINVAYDWKIWDASRDSYNVATKPLWANLTNAEGSMNSIDFLSNGFKLRSSDVIENNSGSTYIFMAFAESPFNYARAR